MGRVRPLVGAIFDRLPVRWRWRLKRFAWPAGVAALLFVRRVSKQGGRDRGTPIEEAYLEEFVRGYEADIVGRVLEVGAATVTTPRRRRVTSVEIVDIDHENDDVTLLADLAESGSLPEGRFDCVICAGALHRVADLDCALANLWQSVAPGGVLFVAVSTVGRSDPTAVAPDRWRIMPAGLDELLDRTCPGAPRVTARFGNARVATALLMGMAAEEVGTRWLATTDDEVPVVVCARVERRASGHPAVPTKSE